MEEIKKAPVVENESNNLKTSIEKILTNYVERLNKEMKLASNDMINDNIRTLHHVIKIKETIDKWN